MPRTSKKYFPEDFKNKIWNNLLKNIKNLKTGKELDKFLNKYLSLDEKILLEKRLGIFDLLDSGFGCRQISREIDVTPKTVCFVKKGFKNSEKKIVKKSKKDGLLFGDFALKKNSKFPTSYSGKGRWNV